MGQGQILKAKKAQIEKKSIKMEARGGKWNKKATCWLRRPKGLTDTLPLSLESNAEISKEGKVAERSEDLIVEAHSDKEDAKPKRVTKKPTYLKDYV